MTTRSGGGLGPPSRDRAVEHPVRVGRAGADGVAVAGTPNSMTPAEAGCAASATAFAGSRGCAAGRPAWRRSGPARSGPPSTKRGSTRSPGAACISVADPPQGAGGAQTARPRRRADEGGMRVTSGGERSGRAAAAGAASCSGAVWCSGSVSLLGRRRGAPARCGSRGPSRPRPGWWPGRPAGRPRRTAGRGRRRRRAGAAPPRPGRRAGRARPRPRAVRGPMQHTRVVTGRVTCSARLRAVLPDVRTTASRCRTGARRPGRRRAGRRGCCGRRRRRRPQP